MLIRVDDLVPGQRLRAAGVRSRSADGQRADGLVTATDPVTDTVTDLAMVQADRRDLPPARFATELPDVGSLAVVIGSPLGFPKTFTAGIISGLHREIPGSAAQGQARHDPGGTVTLTVRAVDGATRSSQITLVDRPASSR